MIKTNYDLVVIGGGSAGMAGALEAHKLGINNVLIIEKNDYLGGILNQCVHNGFGLGEFNEELTGPEFMARLSDQVKNNKIEYLLDTTVTNISKDKQITIFNKKGADVITAKAILFTTGCYERSQGAIMLPGDRPKGIITAGAAQYYLNVLGHLVGKKIFILGSGDIGLIMARRFTLEGAKVLGVAEICPYSNGLNRNIVQCLNDYNIPLFLSHTVSDIHSKDGHLTGVSISKVDEKKNIIPNTEQKFECDTLLLSVGLIPNSPLLYNLGIKLSKNKGAIINERYETSIPGIFTAGNALHVHDLVDLVTKESRLVASYIKEYLDNKSLNNELYLEVNALDGIGYVLPHKVNKNLNHDVIFKFRVKVPIKNVNVVFKDDNLIIKKVIKPVLIPSEMVEISLNLEEINKFKHSINVSLEEVKP